MTTAELVAKEDDSRKEWESGTVAYQTAAGQSVTIADIRKVFDRICNRSDWKAPCAAYVPHELVEVSWAALSWFHGAAWIGGIQPITGRVAVGSDGYAC